MKKKFLPVIVCLTILITLALIYDQTRAAGSDPGSIADPLVTKSYVDEANAKLLTQFEQILSSGGGVVENGTGTVSPNNMTDIYKYIDDKFAIIAQGGVSVSTGFVVVEVEAGQKLICEGSTELILRSGDATAIANTAGDGLTDTTAGKDIKGGEMIASNHLFIVPRTDGRGFSVNKKSYVMVKGNYAIQ